MSKTVKMGTRLQGNYTITLPMGIKIRPGVLSDVPEELLSNPGIVAYLKTGKLYIEEQVVTTVASTGEVVPPAEKEAPVKKPKAKKAADEIVFSDKVDVTEPVSEAEVEQPKEPEAEVEQPKE